MAPNVGYLKVHIVDMETVSTLLPTQITLEPTRSVSTIGAAQKSPTADDPSQIRVVIPITPKARPTTDGS